MIELTNDHQRMLEHIHSRSDQMIELTRSVSAINSGSHNIAGVTRVGEWFKSQFGQLFDELIEEPLPPLEDVNAEGSLVSWQTAPCWVFRRNSSASFQLLCTGHIDTVFPQQSHFQSTRIDGDKLRGPGVADMKGGLVVLCTALAAFFNSPWSECCGVTVVLSPDEEIGSRASAGILDRYGKKAHVGLTYEPCWLDGTLAGARKGSGNYDVVIKGKSAHAGRDYFSGKNAVYAASLLTLRLSALSDEASGVTVNIGRIDGGGAVNVVPEVAVVRFNARVYTDEQRQRLEAAIEDCIQGVRNQTQCDCELFGEFNRPPKLMTPNHERLFDMVKRVGSTLGLSIGWKPSGGCCEGNNLAALGLPNVDTLGVRGANIHSDQEYAAIDSFVERAQLSAVLMAELCSQREQYATSKTC